MPYSYWYIPGLAHPGGGLVAQPQLRGGRDGLAQGWSGGDLTSGWVVSRRGQERGAQEHRRTEMCAPESI